MLGFCFILFYNIVMTEVARLTLELAAIVLKQSATVGRAACHGAVLAAVHLFHKKLLHSHIHVAVEVSERAFHLHLCLIGDAEGALSEHFHYLVVVSLAVQNGVWGEGLCPVIVHNDVLYLVNNVVCCLIGNTWLYG